MEINGTWCFQPCFQKKKKHATVFALGFHKQSREKLMEELKDTTRYFVLLSMGLSAAKKLELEKKGDTNWNKKSISL